MTDQSQRRVKRSPVTTDDRIEIAARLQIDALDLISKANPTFQDMVFHGGTSIAFSQGSPRWSEDLDFMATPEAVQKLFAREATMGAVLQLKNSIADPEGIVSLKVKKGGDGQLGEVSRIDLRWEHPSFIGSVKIKVEFYTCSEAALSNYEARSMMPNWHGYQTRGAIRIATPESVWADKVVALALRPNLKFRDVHDLGFISPRLDPDFDRERFLNASMGIYAKAPEDVLAGLERAKVVDHLHDRDAFFHDMGRWFSKDLLSKLHKSGELADQHRLFLKEYDIARTLAEGMCNAPSCDF